VSPCLRSVCSSLPASISHAARVSLLALLVCSVPTAATAQQESHWVVGASFSPTWSSSDNLKATVGFDGAMEGTEFTIGIGRGSTRGGEWTVSFVHKPLEDTTSSEFEEECFGLPGECFSTNETFTTQDVVLRGMEFVWSGSFVTIANRVQIGLNAGGGFAKPRGTVVETFTQTSAFRNPPPNGPLRTMTFSETFQSDAAEVFYKTVPLFKLEGQVGVIVAPSFKVKFSGGLNNPGYGFRISAAYLIGA
jgi:hypothetical protein